ncbi:MAG: T9SS type A sorting domain-containing protein [Bacteroidota bacterium]
MKAYRRRYHIFMVLNVLLLAGLSLPLHRAVAGNPKSGSPQRMQGTTGNDFYSPFLINNVFNYFGNNGDGAFNKYTALQEGFEFPKNSGKTMMYEEGILWGGFHKGRGTPTVGGSAYRHGLQAGKIISAGTDTTEPVAIDPGDSLCRIFRVRPDVNPAVSFASVESKINTEEVTPIGRYESTTAQEIYDRYVQDWNAWPADQGAPYTDVDGNGMYDPAIDIPGQPGAGQTLWYVANDLNPMKTDALAGSPPIGLEMQRTIWGYKTSGSLGNVVFVSTVLINKSGAPVDSMFIAQWSDPDVGDAGDDFIGCDTVRQMGFAYNGGPVDAMYGAAVPALGFTLIQGPRVVSPGDSALFHEKVIPGYKNLRMSAFAFFTQGNLAYVDPVQGPGGDTQWYNAMGGHTITGAQFLDPANGSQPTKFCLSGDPVKATDGSAGWVDGMNGLTPQDRRIIMAVGPFTMSAGDTQEVVVAMMGGLGADRLSSISALRNVWSQVNAKYDGVIATAPGGTRPVDPESFSLEQNYPNPFNPTTVISGSVPPSTGRDFGSNGVRDGMLSDSWVTLVVYDILGQKVATLIDERMPAGRFSVTFNAQRLSSGVYFYQMQAGSYVETKTMLLVR